MKDLCRFGIDSISVICFDRHNVSVSFALYVKLASCLDQRKHRLWICNCQVIEYKTTETISWKINKSWLCSTCLRYSNLDSSPQLSWSFSWCSLFILCGFSPLSFSVDGWLDSFVLACIPFGWPADTRPPAPFASGTGLIPFMIIRSTDIILFIEAWNWSALPHRRFDPPVLKCASKGWQILSAICQHLLQE